MAAATKSKSNAKIDSSLMKAMASAFSESALPGENEGFDDKACEEAARFTLEVASQPQVGQSSGCAR